MFQKLLKLCIPILYYIEWYDDDFDEGIYNCISHFDIFVSMNAYRFIVINKHY